MLPPNRGPPPGATVDADDDEGGPIDDEKVMANVQLARMREHKYPSDVYELANYIETPTFPALLHAFLDDQLHESELGDVDSDSDDDLLEHQKKITLAWLALAGLASPEHLWLGLKI
ncbi:hypothetical protein BYT27DRAFT_7258204 [Phlegmacium glaucopus]|nr:hypothetical protein BYT27DRAFT_7258204 [Phlegmacium glaucopus]